MRTLIVVFATKDWPLEIPGVEVVSAGDYLTDPQYSATRRAMVFNLCRSYAYQSTGYYVSLLAAARGHRHMPDIQTILDMKSAPVVRIVSDDLDELINKSLGRLQSPDFTLSIYFGKNVAEKYDKLSAQLFSVFRTPLLRATFHNDGRWHLRRISPIAARDIPEQHMQFVLDTARDYFSRPRFSKQVTRRGRYSLAILHNPAEPTPPSDEKALRRFMRAAGKSGLEPELITRDDYGHIAEYDALFIRETTAVEHHTFRFAQRAAAEGLVVIDDPESILRCTNKVYLAELLTRHGIRTPKTVICGMDTVGNLPARLGFPIILKQPDSSFSQGVVKVSNEEELRREALRMLGDSDLIIAQEFTPTEYDWRIGVLDRMPLYACRYFMAHRHWQIIKKSNHGRMIEGRSETLPVSEAPAKAVETALAAANLIGDGLYGVDIKEVGGKFYVIEVNDNPSIEAGYEDFFLKDDLYMAVMKVFRERIEKARGTQS